MECFALLAASLVRDRIGTFVIGILGSYMIMLLTQNMENSASLMKVILVLIFGVAASLWLAAAIFIKWDLRQIIFMFLFYMLYLRTLKKPKLTTE